MNDLTDYEKTILDTKGEKFLLHLETDLRPNKSYKMVVLQYLLSTGKTEWNVDNIGEGFKQFYLDNLEYLADFPVMYNSEEPENFSISKINTHIKNYPLNFLSNTENDCFILDEKAGEFSLKEEYKEFWKEEQFKELVKDRVEFALKRYFHSKKLKIDYNKLAEIKERLSVNHTSIDLHKSQEKIDLISIPFYSDLEIACGTFGDGIANYAEETLLVENIHNISQPERFFIVRAKGNSMNGGKSPIYDGDYLLFEHNYGGSISNQLFAIQYVDEFENSSFVFKRIEKDAEYKYRLVSQNKEYDDIQMNNMSAFARFKYKLELKIDESNQEYFCEVRNF